MKYNLSPWARGYRAHLRHMKKISTKVTGSCKRDQTITITHFEGDKPITRYRSTPLSKQEFDYLSEDATEGDLRNFLKYGSYKEI